MFLARWAQALSLTDCKRNYRHNQKVKVCNAPKLFEQVLRQESEERVFGGHNAVLLQRNLLWSLQLKVRLRATNLNPDCAIFGTYPVTLENSIPLDIFSPSVAKHSGERNLTIPQSR